MLKMTSITKYDIDVKIYGTVTWWKRAKKFGQGPSPFRAIPERIHFFPCEVFPNTAHNQFNWALVFAILLLHTGII